jgi:hypothetical protein
LARNLPHDGLVINNKERGHGALQLGAFRQAPNP